MANFQQFIETALPQIFSLPKPIMKYIWSNPLSPKTYQILIKSCKIFFVKNPILILRSLEYDHFLGWNYCNSDDCSGSWYCNHKHEKINMDIIKAKIWMMKKFSVRSEPNLILAFISKIYQYDVDILALSDQHLLYNNLKFLAAGVKICYLQCNVVTYSDGKKVALEDIIKIFPGAKKVLIWFLINSENAACKNYVDFIGSCSTIKEINLIHIDNDIFDILKFYQHLKRSNNYAKINISVRFHVHYLDVVIDEILQTEIFEFVPPVIQYFQQNKSDLQKMKEIQACEAAKYC